MIPPGRPLTALAALTVLALAGCATVRPASTVPPTGWPEPSTSGSATASPGAPVPTPTASPSSATLTRLGVTVPIPAGYLDATALVTDAPTTGVAQLVALLRNPGQHQITVQLVSTDYKTLSDFLSYYVKAQNAGTEASVTGQREVTIAGRTGAELTLKGAEDGHLSTLFVVMRAPGSLVMVNGESSDEQRRKAVAFVAEGITLP